VASDQISTRESILLAAQQCFADHGYAATSLNDIAAEVGIRRPSLLHHFASKEALYGEVFERSLSDWLVRLEDAVSGVGDDGWALVEAVLNVSAEFFVDNPDVVRVLRREAIDGGVNLGIDMGGILRPLFNRAKSFLQREMDAGTFRTMEPEYLLLSAYGALLSYFSDAPLIAGLIDGDPLGADRVAGHIASLRDLYQAALRPG
jgi:TetR/AcrR family transcriptional regulator